MAVEQDSLIIDAINQPNNFNASLLSPEEQKNAAASLYPIDSESTTVSSSTPKASTEDAAATKTTNSAVNAGNNETPSPVPNPLHAYPNYTYGLTLHALTAENFNTLSKGGPKQFKPQKTLISSASRYHDKRLPSFKDDFYFDNFKMSTVIGLNSHSQGTNAIQLSFTIIEPYGLTLLNRLIDINVQELGANNYLDIPYLLEINFFAYDDNGKIANLAEHTKFIPIKLTEMKIKASVRGGEYAISAVPFNHTAYMESSSASPANFEVIAKTVQEFFSSDSLDSNQLKQINDLVPNPPKEGVDSAQTTNTDVRTTTTGEKSKSEGTNTADTPAPTPRITSFVAAYNAWQQQAAKNGVQEFADEIKVEFDSAMKTNIVYAKKNPSDKAPIKGTVSAADRAKSNNPDTQKTRPTIGPDFERQSFNINAGTSLMTLIGQVLLNSQYITNQILDPTLSSDLQNSSSVVDSDSFSSAIKKQAINWYKIIPSVTLGPFDKKRNQYQRKTVYHVKTFKYHNSKDSRANQSFPDGYAKKYDYMFTGKNNDIIDFDIDFNTLYYTAAQSDLSKTQQTAKQQDNETPNSSNSRIKINGSGNSVTPVSFKPVADQVGTGILNASTDSTKKQAHSVQESLLSTPRGDMLNLKLKIIGDPHFIKQDDIYENPSQESYDDSKMLLVNTNSLVMDAAEIYCYVTFKTPVDIDETTGLLRKDSKYSESVFSGYYRVLTVESEFVQGKFTQSLEMVRQFNQPGDDKSSNADQVENATNADNRNTDKNLAEGNKINDPKISPQQADSGNQTAVSTTNSSSTVNLSKQSSSSTTIATTSGGGATITRADGTVTKLADNPNQAQRANAQAITEFNENTSQDQSLSNIVNSDFVVGI
jgi:hypothetical protein